MEPGQNGRSVRLGPGHEDSVSRLPSSSRLGQGRQSNGPRHGSTEPGAGHGVGLMFAALTAGVPSSQVSRKFARDHATVSDALAAGHGTE